MSSYAKTFTVVATGLALRLKPGESLTYTAVVAALESFSGHLQLQRSRNGQQSWELVLALDGTTVAIDPGTTTGTIVNESGGIEYYRWVNITATGADEIVATLADVVDADKNAYVRDGVLYTGAGVEVARVNDDGTLRITSATITNFATLFAAAVNALPTADPHVAGALWLDTGVLTVSAG